MTYAIKEIGNRKYFKLNESETTWVTNKRKATEFSTQSSAEEMMYWQALDKRLYEIVDI